MPRLDGTGPMGNGEKTGKGLGMCEEAVVQNPGKAAGMGMGRGLGQVGRGPAKGAGRGFGQGAGRTAGRGMGRGLRLRDGSCQEIEQRETLNK